MKIAKGSLTRRDLIKRFGMLGFLLTPVARALGYVAGGTFEGAPRFVMFFKGGSFRPDALGSGTWRIDALTGPIAPLQPYASDLILFQNMAIHGGSPKSNGYQSLGELGGLIRELHRDPTAERVPDQRRALMAKRQQQVAQADGERPDRVVTVTRRGRAVPGQVGRHHRVVTR